jgi:hypothetical protein
MSERAHYAVEGKLLVVAVVDVNDNEAGVVDEIVCPS